MQNENTSELLLISNEMLYNMDCSSEGSTDSDCDCDGVDNS
jgi:hypothetical protein